MSKSEKPADDLLEGLRKQHRKMMGREDDPRFYVVVSADLYYEFLGKVARGDEEAVAMNNLYRIIKRDQIPVQDDDE